MTFVPTSSFYVTLMSHASTREFPHNRSSHFKNRLPKPIRFVGRGWQVGMVSLSLPTIPVVGEEFFNEKEPLLFVRWHERVYDQDDEGNDRWWHERRELKILGKDMKEGLLSSTGYHFFKNWFIATIKKEPIEPNPKTNGLRTLAASCTFPLNGPPGEIFC